MKRKEKSFQKSSLAKRGTALALRVAFYRFDNECPITVVFRIDRTELYVEDNEESHH